MPVGDEVEAFVTVLKGHPVLQGTDKVAEMELSARLHPAENPILLHDSSLSVQSLASKITQHEERACFLCKINSLSS
jgi:hypothetical protein